MGPRRSEAEINKVSQGMFGVLVVVMAAAMFLSDRAFLPHNMPRIETITTLPDSPKTKDVRWYTEIGSGILPYTARERTKRAAAPPLQRQPLKLGYSYREVSFLRMPFWAYEEYGLVTFLDTAAGYQLALLSPAQLKLIEEASGRHFSKDDPLRWLRHLWGWLFVAGFLAAAGLYLREHARWRQEQGII